MTDQSDSAECCEPDAESDEPGEPRTHYLRTCAGCGHQWEGLHCVHDGFQNPCPGCGKRPERPDSAGLYHNRLAIPAGVARPGRSVRLHMAFAAAPLLAMGCGQREEEPSEPRLTVDDYEKVLAADPFLRGIAADRAARVAAFPMFDDSKGNPIADMRRACKVIEASTGQRSHCLMMSVSHVARIVQTLRELIENAERFLGIGRPAEGKFPTGWPWALREGRPSREEKRLRDVLSGWRSALAKLTSDEPARAFEFPTVIINAAPAAGIYRYISPCFVDANGNEIRTPISNRRPTGKGAQRRMSKPWAGRNK